MGSYFSRSDPFSKDVVNAAGGAPQVQDLLLFIDRKGESAHSVERQIRAAAEDNRLLADGNQAIVLEKGSLHIAAGSILKDGFEIAHLSAVQSDGEESLARLASEQRCRKRETEEE